MRRLFVFLVISGTLLGQSRPKQETPSDQKNREAKESPALSTKPTSGTSAQVDTPPSDNSANKPEEKSKCGPPPPLWDIYWPTWALVIVGGFAAAAALWTLGKLQEQIEEAKKASKIANDAAEAARLNAQAVINSERPWILISLSNGGSGTRYSIIGINTGRTPAANVSYFYDIAYEKSVDELPSSPDYGEGKPFPNIVVSSDNFPVYIFDTNEILSVEKREPLRKEGKKAIFWGRVLYQDAVIPKGISPEIHESRFCYWTDPVQVEFTREGPAEYNRHT